VRAVGFIPVTPCSLGKRQPEAKNRRSRFLNLSAAFSISPRAFGGELERYGVDSAGSADSVRPMKTLRIKAAATRRPLALVALVLTVATLGNAVVSGCGGSKSSESSSQNTNTSTTPEASAPAPAPAGTPPESGAAGAQTAAFDPSATFKSKCSVCHGPDGRGNGPGAAALNPKPRNYHDQAYMKTRTDQQLHDSVFNGKSGMPAWGKSGALTDAQVWAMIKYVRQVGSTP